MCSERICIAAATAVWVKATVLDVLEVHTWWPILVQWFAVGACCDPVTYESNLALITVSSEWTLVFGSVLSAFF